MAVVNQRFVEQYLPEDAGVGSRFEMGGEGVDWEVLGVVGSVQQSPRGRSAGATRWRRCRWSTCPERSS